MGQKGSAMVRTAGVLSLILASAAAAGVAALRAPRRPPADPPAATAREGALQLSVRLDRRWLDSRGGASYLEIGVAADGMPERGPRTAVNAVLVIDRSGSMSGEKIARARDAARALIAALDGEDRLAIVDFASDAHLLLASAQVTPAFKEVALAQVSRLQATSGTNLSAALDLSAPQLERGRAPSRLDKVFLATDGLANEGVSDRAGLLRIAARDFGRATVSTFGIGEDYDEDLLAALAAQGGGRTRFIHSASELEPAMRAELTRAARTVARDVRLEVRGSSGTRVVRVLGYGADGGSIRLPDFAAGEERRVLVKLSLAPAAEGEGEVARVALSFADPAGAAHHSETVARGSFTAKAALLGMRANDALAHGARAELAELARDAAEMKGDGRAEEARQRVDEMQVLLRSVTAAAPPAAMPALEKEAKDYKIGLDGIRGGGDVPSKRVKQQAFDSLRAPVSGW
ncbi:MAG: VWA domain-containing protein [Deltaproteobacteria bacterium]|nr:MAG: VWA domain-containing protein [Deltaproteobacteria bacterium]